MWEKHRFMTLLGHRREQQTSSEICGFRLVWLTLRNGLHFCINEAAAYEKLGQLISFGLYETELLFLIIQMKQDD